MNANANTGFTMQETTSNKGDGLWAKRHWLLFGLWYVVFFFFTFILVLTYDITFISIIHNERKRECRVYNAGNKGDGWWAKRHWSSFCLQCGMLFFFTFILVLTYDITFISIIHNERKHKRRVYNAGNKGDGWCRLSTVQ